MARGYGHLRLKDGRIWTLLTTMSELKGYEEPRGRAPARRCARSGQDRKNWKEEREAEAREPRHHNPALRADHRRRPGRHRPRRAAEQLGVPTIIVEKNERAGDSWRKRYKSLCLHDPVWYDHMPYLPFPELAGLLAQGQDRRLAGDVHQGHGAELLGLDRVQERRATTRRAQEWTVVVERDGKDVVLRPKQLVLATGMAGKPNMPDVPGQRRIQGRPAPFVSKHPGPDEYAGKKCGGDRLEQLRARHLRGACGSTAPT